MFYDKTFCKLCRFNKLCCVLNANSVIHFLCILKYNDQEQDNSTEYTKRKRREKPFLFEVRNAIYNTSKYSL